MKSVNGSTPVLEKKKKVLIEPLGVDDLHEGNIEVIEKATRKCSVDPGQELEVLLEQVVVGHINCVIAKDFVKTKIVRAKYDIQIDYLFTAPSVVDDIVTKFQKRGWSASRRSDELANVDEMKITIAP